MMDIASMATGYLAEDRSPWISASRRVSYSVAKWLTLLDTDESDYVERHRLEDKLFTVLMGPRLVRRLANESDGTALTALAERLAQVIRKTSVELPEDPDEDWLGDIVDLGSAKIIRRSDLLDTVDEDDLFSPASVLTSFQMVPLSVDTSELETVVSSALAEVDSELSLPDRSVFQLQPVDAALYGLLTHHPELLRTLDWRVFEELLADILNRLGYEVELRQGTKDGGIDLFALKKHDVMGAQRFLLQAKRWSHRVGVEPVRQLAFLHAHHKVTKACLATTATFTRGAWELANQYRWQLELRDFQGIHDWIRLASRP